MAYWTPPPLQLAQMLVATESCEIYEVLDSDGTNLHRGPMLQGHFGNGVRGLAAHPTNPDEFASAGLDRTVRVWSRSGRKIVSHRRDLYFSNSNACVWPHRFRYVPPIPCLWIC